MYFNCYKTASTSASAYDFYVNNLQLTKMLKSGL